MDKLELSKLLATASIIDHRNVEPETIEMWHKIISDLPLDFTMDAVVAHFQQSRDYLKPVDIRQRVSALVKANREVVEEGKLQGQIAEDWPGDRKLTDEQRQEVAAFRWPTADARYEALDARAERRYRERGLLA